jgi:hypothetical protein
MHVHPDKLNTKSNEQKFIGTEIFSALSEAYKELEVRNLIIDRRKMRELIKVLIDLPFSHL